MNGWLSSRNNYGVKLTLRLFKKSKQIRLLSTPVLFFDELEDGWSGGVLTCGCFCV